MWRVGLGNHENDPFIYMGKFQTLTLTRPALLGIFCTRFALLTMYYCSTCDLIAFMYMCKLYMLVHIHACINSCVLVILHVYGCVCHIRCICISSTYDRECLYVHKHAHLLRVLVMADIIEILNLDRCIITLSQPVHMAEVCR